MAILLEEVLIPTRFITTAAHFIAVITVAYDLSGVTFRSNPSNYNQQLSALTGLTWTSIACFILEFLGMFSSCLTLTFSGASLFLPTVNCFYILAHFIGCVVVALFSANHWQVVTFAWFFAFFSALPACVEMLVAVAVFQLKLLL